MDTPDFGKEIGPLPLGAWVVVVGGGLGIAWWSRRNKSDPGPALVTDTSGVPGVGAGFDAYVPAVNVGSSTTDTAPPITTNEEWGRAAINYLIAKGYDPLTSDSAIRKFLAVEQLTPTEWALMRIAYVHLGAPPSQLPPPPEPPSVPVVTPVPQPPPPGPPPPPRPATIRLIRVEPWRAGRSTLWGMAKEFYGDGNQWPRIYAANRKGTTRPDGSPGYISNPSYLRPGDLVYVP